MLSKSEFETIDTVILKYARVILRGVAEKSNEKIVNATNQEVWQRIRCVPTKLELRIRRLKALANWAMYPEQNKQIIAAMFGSPKCMEDREIGFFEKHPWLEQAIEDIMSISSID